MASVSSAAVVAAIVAVDVAAAVVVAVVGLANFGAMVAVTTLLGMK